MIYGIIWIKYYEWGVDDCLSKRGWTQEDIDYLIESYNSLDIKVKDIAKNLNKSQDSIVKKASSLGIRKIKFTDIEVPQGHRICRICKEIKPVSEFYVNRSKKSDPYDSSCKVCSSEKAKERRNKKILEKIQAEVDKADNEKLKEREDFIKSCKGKLFKCALCKEDLPIEKFTLVKKYGKITNKVFCKKCACIKNKERVLNKLRKDGHL